MNRWLFLWRQLRRRLWLRATLYAVSGVAAAVLAVLFGWLVPDSLADRFGGESVASILGILASSMLAVATFSLGAMVTAYTAVSQAATPRVAELVTGDDATQKALSTFIGAFLFAIVGVVAINAHYYGPRGRAILFLCALAMVLLVAYRLLAWISRLSKLARVGHMIELVEDRTAKAMNELRAAPQLTPRRAADSLTGPPVEADRTGHVQNVDVRALQTIAEDCGLRVEILAGPGVLARRGEPLARLSGEPESVEAIEQIKRAFAISPTRSFDQDPRFGLSVLGEISARALSPGVNDPGTALAVLSTGLRLMDDWARRLDGATDTCPRVLAAPILAEELLDDVFGPSMRYGAGDYIVAMKLRRVLGSLAPLGAEMGGAARRMAAEALQRSSGALDPADLARLKTIDV